MCVYNVYDVCNICNVSNVVCIVLSQYCFVLSCRVSCRILPYGTAWHGMVWYGMVACMYVCMHAPTAGGPRPQPTHRTCVSVFARFQVVSGALEAA